MIFGGDGIFLAQLMGPGTVWLQTLPISRLAHQIYEYLPKAPAEQAGAVGGAGLLGGIVGSILSGGQCTVLVLLTALCLQSQLLHLRL